MCCVGRFDQNHGKHSHSNCLLITFFYQLLCTSAMTPLAVGCPSTGCLCLALKDKSAMLACLFFQSSQSAVSRVHPSQEPKGKGSTNYIRSRQVTCNKFYGRNLAQCLEVEATIGCEN
jgi:hypothetical protein